MNFFDTITFKRDIFKPTYLYTILFLLDGVRQFVVVTSIDEIGVPNGDMINAYKYPCVRKFCDEGSVVFGVDLLHVIPVSNYFDNVAPNDAKMPCLSLTSGVSLILLKNILNDGGPREKRS